MIINKIRINIRQQRIITKMYGGAKPRFGSFKLLIPPGRKVLGYSKEKQCSFRMWLLSQLITCAVVAIKH